MGNKDNEIQDKKLVYSAKQNRKNFKFLYNKYYEQIFLFLLRRSANEDLAQELTQQTFIKAMVNLEQFEFKGFPFSSWLYRIAVNELNLFYRSTKKQRTISIDNEGVNEIADEVTDDAPGFTNEDLINIINQLNEEEVYLLEMKYFEKRSHKEISEILGISIPNAKTKLHRVIKKMKSFAK